MIYDIQNQSSFENIQPNRRRHKKKVRHQQSIKSSFDISTTLELRETLKKQCRICLQSEEQDYNNPLIAPCDCTGSAKYAHERCYRRWIQRQYTRRQKKQQKQMLQLGIECQICKQRIFLQFKTKFACKSCAKFRQGYHKSRRLFWLFLFYLMTNISCLSYLSLYTAHNGITLDNSLTILIVVIVSFVFLVGTGIAATYYFVKDFFVVKIWCLSSFGLRTKSSPQYHKGNKLKVHPISIEQVIE